MSVDLLGRDPASLVLDGEHDPLVCRRLTFRGRRSCSSRPPFAIARRPLVARFQTICRIWFSSASHQTGSAGTSTSMMWCALHFRAVAQQERGVLNHLPHVESRQREPLRPRVGQKRSDRVVQPLRLAQHDVHQLRLLFAEGQLLPEHLNRAGHRRQRVADLVRDAGRHLADRREPLLKSRVALEPSHVGDVLERDQI